MLFPANLQRLERMARIVLGTGMMVGGWIAADGVVAFALRLFAVYPLATGLVGWSPLYEIFTFNRKR